MKKYKKTLQVNRYWVVAIGFGLCFAIVLGRLFYLQIARHDFYVAQAKEQHFGSIKIPAKRGEILVKDPRSGDYYKLATNITLDLLYVDPLLSEDERQTAEKLAPFIYRALCADKKALDCTNLVAAYTETTLPQENTNSAVPTSLEPQKPEQLQSAIAQYAYRQISQKEVTKVVLKTFYIDTPEVETLKSKVTGYGLDGIFVDKTMIWADPTRIRNKEETAVKLTTDLEIPADDLIAKLARRPARYIPLVNKISPDISEEIKALDLPGVVLIPEHWRFYPEKNLAAQTVGFLDYAGIGQYGIEGKFDPILRGVEGEIESENDLLGRHLIVGQGNIKAAQDGSSVVLTIDRVVQAEVERQLGKAVEDFRANSGQVIVLDPFSGDIIAMANYPTFDPNKYADVYKTKEISFDPGKTMTVLKKTPAGKYLTYENKFGPFVFINHIVNSLYEPGSIFKPLTVASGIDAGEITPRTMYLDKGELTVDEYTIHNVSQACLGYNDMTHALNYSCNIGMATIAKKLGKSLFYHYVTRFGFGDRTDVELDGEAKGIVKYFRNWAASNLANIAYGQGISVTPLQMATAYAAIANGGLLLQPHVVQEIIRPDGSKEESTVQVVRRVVSKETADTVTAMMISSVENGVAKRGRLDQYFVAGKTGTAQIACSGHCGPDQAFEEGEGSTIAGFGGYVPANNPKFVMIVKIDRPRSSPWGDSTAAPLFHDIAQFLVDYYNLPPDR